LPAVIANRSVALVRVAIFASLETDPEFRTPLL
jgi:hypothetical protein